MPQKTFSTAFARWRNQNCAGVTASNFNLPTSYGFNPTLRIKRYLEPSQQFAELVVEGCWCKPNPRPDAAGHRQSDSCRRRCSFPLPAVWLPLQSSPRELQWRNLLPSAGVPGPGQHYQFQTHPLQGAFSFFIQASGFTHRPSIKCSAPQLGVPSTVPKMWKVASHYQEKAHCDIKHAYPEFHLLSFVRLSTFSNILMTKPKPSKGAVYRDTELRDKSNKPIAEEW